MTGFPTTKKNLHPWPCHMKPRSQWCDHAGKGGFMGHTCVEPAKSETVVATNLGAMLRCFMAMERYSMRELAPQIGISAATLHRLCRGYAMDGATLLKVINWMAKERV